MRAKWTEPLSASADTPASTPTSTRTLYFYENDSFAPLAQFVDQPEMELDPLQALQQTSPQSPTQISSAQAQAANDFWMGLEPSNTARGEDSEDEEDDANWNPRQTVQRFSQRMQAQGRFLRAQMQENKR